MAELQHLSERLLGEVLSSSEAARMLNISRQAVQQAISRGRIDAYKAGRSIFPVLQSVIKYGMSSRRPLDKREALAKTLRETSITKEDTWQSTRSPH
jgi:excisionase family DNA binding protein